MPIDPRSWSRRVSRRAMLVGAGGAAGAAALGAVPVVAAGVTVDPQARSDGGEDPPSTSGAPPLAVTPGVHYRTWSLFDFIPTDFATGKVVTPYGAHCATSNGGLVVGVDLEARTQLVEVTFGVSNTSGAVALPAIQSYGLTGTGGAALATVSIPSTSTSSVQLGSATFSHTVSADLTYDAYLFTYANGAVCIRSMRLGYIPFGYGFTPVTPTRVYDSRAGNAPLGVTKGQLSNGTRVINMINGLTLPVTPKGVLTTTTVVNTSASGFLALYQNGITWPGTSSVNWFTANEVVANTAYTDVDAAGQAVAKVPANSSTDFFVDVVGYYA